MLYLNGITLYLNGLRQQLTQKYSSLKMNIYYIFPLCQESKHSFAGCLWLRLSHKAYNQNVGVVISRFQWVYFQTTYLAIGSFQVLIGH